MHVGKKIKELVKNARLTNEEFAIKLGKHPKYVYQIFKQQHINTELLEDIAKIFNKDIIYFLNNIEESNQVNEACEPYGKNYQDKLIQSLERENKMLREEIARLKKENI